MSVLKHLMNTYEHKPSICEVNSIICNSCPHTSAHGTAILARHGVVTNLQQIPPSQCRRLLKYIIRMVDNDEINTRDSAMGLRKSKFRFDLYLPARGAPYNFLRNLLQTWSEDSRSPLNYFRQQSEPVRLVEFSLLGSLPGAEAQGWHTDHGQGRGKLISFGIPLIDVTMSDGPLEAIPFGMSSKRKRKPFQLCAHQGHMFAWDGAVRHRGSANTGQFCRPILMFTLAFTYPVLNGDSNSAHEDIHACLPHTRKMTSKVQRRCLY